MSVTRNPILPMIVSRGTDQALMSSAYNLRDKPDVVRNYGDLLINISNVVPDGIICFFTSYDYMERTIATWYVYTSLWWRIIYTCQSYIHHHILLFFILFFFFLCRDRTGLI